MGICQVGWGGSAVRVMAQTAHNEHGGKVGLMCQAGMGEQRMCVLGWEKDVWEKCEELEIWLKRYLLTRV